MSNLRSSGLYIFIVLIIFTLIGITIASSLDNQTENSLYENNIEQLTQEIADEISTYIQIKDQKGKFIDYNGTKKINKIALWISPLISQDIDLSELTIQLQNYNNVRILTYNKNPQEFGPYNLFTHPIWTDLDYQNFSFVSIIDKDRSLIDFGIINENSDNLYLVFKLPEDMAIKKHERIEITLFPSTGLTKKVILKAPLPINQVITFE